MWCTAVMAHSIGWYRINAAGLDWLEILAMSGFVFGKQKFVIEPLRLLDDRMSKSIRTAK